MCTKLRAQRTTGKCSTVQLNPLPQPMNSEEINWGWGVEKDSESNQKVDLSVCLKQQSAELWKYHCVILSSKRNRPKITNEERLYCKTHYTEKLHKPNLFCMHACVCMCVGIHMCVGVYALTHACMQMPEANSGQSALITFHFAYWEKVSCWIHFIPVLASLASKLAGRFCCLCLLTAGITGGHHTCLVFITFTWVLVTWSIVLMMAERAFVFLSHFPSSQTYLELLQRSDELTFHLSGYGCSMFPLIPKAQIKTAKGSRPEHGTMFRYWRPYLGFWKDGCGSVKQHLYHLLMATSCPTVQRCQTVLWNKGDTVSWWR